MITLSPNPTFTAFEEKTQLQAVLPVLPFPGQSLRTLKTNEESKATYSLKAPSYGGVA